MEKDYKKLILDKVLSKHNSRVAKQSNTNRRVILKPREIYRKYEDNNADILIKQSIHEAVEMLEKIGVVTADRLKFSTDIEKIYLCEKNLDTAYDYLHKEYGITPKSKVLEQAGSLLERYESCGELVRYYKNTVYENITGNTQSRDRRSSKIN